MKHRLLVITAVLAAACSDNPIASRTATGAIHGTVTAYSIEGQPVPFANATVAAYRIATDSSGTPQPFAPRAWTAFTDAQGAYQVDSLPSGSYAVLAVDPAFPQRHATKLGADVTGGVRTRVDLLMSVDTAIVDSTAAPGGPVASVLVSPPSQTISVGDSAGAIAMTSNAQHQLLDGRGVTWTISDSSVVSVTQAAYNWILLRGARSGTVTLTATSEGVSGTATLTVR